MKMSKNIVLLSITIVTLITLVAIATYSYFTASTNLNNKITTNVKMPLRPTFVVSGGGEITLSITREDLLYTNETKLVKQSSKNLIVTLTGEPETTCTYNVYYKDINGNYNPAGAGGMWELAFALIKNNNTVMNVEYYNISSRTATSKITAFFGGSSFPFNQDKPVITIPTGSTSATDNWGFNLYFYNRA